MDEAPTLNNNHIIELSVPLTDIGAYVTTLFADSEFISPIQKLVVKECSYNEQSNLLDLVLYVETETLQ